MTTTGKTFTAFGSLLTAGMAAASVVVVVNEATLFLPVTIVLAVFGVFCAWGGITGYVDQQVVYSTSDDAENDKPLYIAAVLLGMLIPVVGFIIGIVLLARGTTRYGLMAMVGSIGAALLYYQFLIR